MNQPLISAVITTHDRLQLLKRAIESVQNQTYKNIELIVVDDWSSDGTKEFCESQNLKYIYIPPEESKGGNHARNLGIKNAIGEYIAFLDDDDYWFPEKTQKQVDLLLQNKACGFVFCGRRFEKIQSNGSTFEFNYLPKSQYSGDLSKVILQAIVTSTSAIMVSRQLLNKVGLFDEALKFWQEYELTIRLAQVTPFYYVNEPLVVYRENLADKNRLSNKFYTWKKSVKYIRKKHRALYSQLTIKERVAALRTYWSDGCTRAINNGLKLETLKFQIALCITNPAHYKLFKITK
jgi:glycosyltransferase involved in cell wall biosynthesis